VELLFDNRFIVVRLVKNTNLGFRCDYFVKTNAGRKTPTSAFGAYKIETQKKVYWWPNSPLNTPLVFLLTNGLMHDNSLDEKNLP